MKRRALLQRAGFAGIACFAGACLARPGSALAAAPDAAVPNGPQPPPSALPKSRPRPVSYRVKHTDAQWRAMLAPDRYDILRREGTEVPFTSPLLTEHRAGVFACAGCGQPLFTSAMKFESGTGWPSFFTAIPGALQTKRDFLLIVPRTEYHCAKCGGHHGHVFNDGPQPTGLRYCNNGVALKFLPKSG